MSREFKPGDRVRVKAAGGATGTVMSAYDDIVGVRWDLPFWAVDPYIRRIHLEPAPDAAGGEDLTLREQIARELAKQDGWEDPGVLWTENLREIEAGFPGRPVYMDYLEDADAILPLFASLQERVSQAEGSEFQANPQIDGGLSLLAAAIEAGDPKSELLFRIKDLRTDYAAWERRIRAAAEARTLAAEQALEPLIEAADQVRSYLSCGNVDGMPRLRDDLLPKLRREIASAALKAIAHQIRTRGAGRGEEAGDA